MCTPSLSVLLHDAVACMYISFLERQMSAKRFLHIILRMNVDAGGFRRVRLRHSCHEIVIVHKSSYLTGLVAFNADLSLRPVVHGNRGCVIFERLSPNMS